MKEGLLNISISFSKKDLTFWVNIADQGHLRRFVASMPPVLVKQMWPQLKWLPRPVTIVLKRRSTIVVGTVGIATPMKLEMGQELGKRTRMQVGLFPFSYRICKVPLMVLLKCLLFFNKIVLKYNSTLAGFGIKLTNQNERFWTFLKIECEII